jgi:cellulose synthase/poly-beta-1,6-N-acetylglucosamine synthase-like glycosyltransferase
MVDFAQYGILIILSFLLVLHFCIILKIIPGKIVWGNRLKSDKEMYRFEIVSIILIYSFCFPYWSTQIFG